MCAQRWAADSTGSGDSCLITANLEQAAKPAVAWFCVVE